MAKRFTDTEKWKKQWLRELTPTLKCFWFYLLDTCDQAGLWNVDLPLAEFCIGKKLPLYDKILSLFDGRILPVNKSKWWAVDFILFQYKCPMESLNKNNRAHMSVINLITKYRLTEVFLRGLKGASKPLPIPSLGCKDKDKEQDKETDTTPAHAHEDQNTSEVDHPGPKKLTLDESFVLFWEAYPRKVGREKALKSWKSINPSTGKVLTILKAVENQGPTFERAIAQAKDEGKPKKHYIPHPTTWLNQGRWDDEIDDIGEPSPGDPNWLPSEKYAEWALGMSDERPER